jgi:hypothetical protein
LSVSTKPEVALSKNFDPNLLTPGIRAAAMCGPTDMKFVIAALDDGLLRSRRGLAEGRMMHADMRKRVAMPVCVKSESDYYFSTSAGQRLHRHGSGPPASLFVIECNQLGIR